MPLSSTGWPAFFHSCPIFSPVPVALLGCGLRACPYWPLFALVLGAGISGGYILSSQ